MARPSSLPDGRLQLIYEGEGLGGEKTMRARVIRELIDEIRALRLELRAGEALTGAGLLRDVPSKLDERFE